MPPGYAWSGMVHLSLWMYLLSSAAVFACGAYSGASGVFGPNFGKKRFH